MPCCQPPSNRSPARADLATGRFGALGLPAALALAVVAFVPATPAGAATFAEMDLDALTAASSRVVRGFVIETRSRNASPDSRRIVTDVTVEVAEDLLDGGLDSAQPHRVVFTTLGGVLDDRGQRVLGLPEYRSGDEVLLFLGQPIRTFHAGGPPSEPVEHRPVVGLALGAFFAARPEDGGPVRYGRRLDRTPAAATPAFAWYELSGAPGEYVRWYQDEIPVLLDSGLTPDADDAAVRAAVAASIATWNAVDCPHPLLASPVEVMDVSPLHEMNGQEHGTNLIVFQDEDEWAARHTTALPGIIDMSRVLALTTLYYHPYTGMAESFSLEVNDGAYTFSTTGFMATNDIQNMLTHELGHVLGLDHPCRDRDLCGETTMYYSAPAGEVKKRDLHPDDIAGLCGLYGEDWVPTPPPGPTAVAGGGCAGILVGDAPTGPLFPPVPMLLLVGLAVVLIRRSGFTSRR